MHTFDAHNIFPEYFIVSIPLFDDVIKEEIDEWLYLMKHSEVKEDFKSPYMQKVAQRLSILKMTNQEREVYDTYVMDSMKGRDYIISAEARGEARGEAKGKAEGEEKKAIEIAKAMLTKNKPMEEIIEFTGLTIKQIEKLK
jgi:predicted transposase/invertase (TIGR01784 family)